ncbi:MAG: hypothetical protein JWM93_3990 [Frankiales bacterium]|nr:hypothetical protein [Frankiales bacterium]
MTSSERPSGWVAVPESARRLRSGYVVSMGPPRGVGDDECGTVQMLREGAGDGMRAVGSGFFAYWRPTPEQLQQLNAGAVLELGQFGQVVQPFSLEVWTLDADEPAASARPPQPPPPPPGRPVG